MSNDFKDLSIQYSELELRLERWRNLMAIGYQFHQQHLEWPLWFEKELETEFQLEKTKPATATADPGKPTAGV